MNNTNFQKKEMKKLSLLTLFTLMSISCALTKPSLTPEETGLISGTIIDSRDGSPVPYASVITEPPTGAVTADAQGRYRIADVPPGTYTLLVAKPGYTTASDVAVAVVKGKTTTADLQLVKIISENGDNLVAYYPFNMNADDESGYGNHGRTYARRPVAYS